MQHVANPVSLLSFYCIILVVNKNKKNTYSINGAASSVGRRFVPRRLESLLPEISLSNGCVEKQVCCVSPYILRGGNHELIDVPIPGGLSTADIRSLGRQTCSEFCSQLLYNKDTEKFLCLEAAF